MAFERRNYTGGATPTTLAAGINPTALSITITSSTGWPSGGANGPFFVVIDRGLAGEEKVEVASRTGTTLTVANTGKRGVDGTAAGDHSLGASISHAFTAQDADEANAHVTNTALDHHTQYLNTTRHDVTARHTIGTAIPATGTPSTVTPDGAASNGASNNVARVDHTHASPAATAATVTGTNAEGASASFARADHNHAIGGTNHIPAAALVNDSLTAAQIAANAIGASELADNAVDTAAIANAAVTLAKFASEATTDWTASITFDNVVLGAGGEKYASYFKLGRLVLLFSGFILGVGGDVTGKLGFNLPFVPADLTSASIANRGGIVVGRAVEFPSGTAWSGLGAILDADNKATDISTAGSTGAAWGFSASSPLWTAGQGTIFQGLVLYVATA